MQESFSGGLGLMDLEQLQLEKAGLGIKLAARDHEITKFRQKRCEVVQVWAPCAVHRPVKPSIPFLPGPPPGLPGGASMMSRAVSAGCRGRGGPWVPASLLRTFHGLHQRVCIGRVLMGDAWLAIDMDGVVNERWSFLAQHHQGPPPERSV